MLDYGADVSIRPEPISNQSVSGSNVALKNAPNIQPAQQGGGKTIVSSVAEYEYWIVADSSELAELPIGHHVFNTIISRNKTVYSDNTLEYTPWIFYSSYGSWPDKGMFNKFEPFSVVNGGIKYNWEKSDVSNILNGLANGRYAVRKVKISSSLKSKIENNAGYSGCSSSKYSIAGTGENCSYTSFATRMWYLVTKEDFRPSNVWFRAPLTTFYSINNYNQNGEFTNNNEVLTYFKSEGLKIAMKLLQIKTSD